MLAVTDVVEKDAKLLAKALDELMVEFRLSALEFTQAIAADTICVKLKTVKHKVNPKLIDREINKAIVRSLHDTLIKLGAVYKGTYCTVRCYQGLPHRYPADLAAPGLHGSPRKFTSRGNEAMHRVFMGMEDEDPQIFLFEYNRYHPLS